MPVSLRIDVGALRSIAQRLGEPLARKVGELIATRYSPVLWRKLVENSPVKGPGRTGALAQKWSVTPVAAGGVRIRNTAKYSSFVEDDTRPHLIRPRSRSDGRVPFLAWRTGRRGPVSAARATTATASGQRGQWSYVSKSIRHPGTKGQRIIPRSVAETIDDLTLIARQETELVIREFIAQPIR